MATLWTYDWTFKCCNTNGKIGNELINLIRFLTNTSINFVMTHRKKKEVFNELIKLGFFNF